jgi:hypothetical protein
MPTFDQALLLGTERLTAAPTPAHPVLDDAWQQLDWVGAKETALLEAAALVGASVSAGATVRKIAASSDIAATEVRPYAPQRAVMVLPQLFVDEWRMLLPEWLELCGQRSAIVPPFYLRTLFEIVTHESDRALLRQVAGERGCWLARQNSEWTWLIQASPAQASDDSAWETGTTAERLAWFSQVRVADPARALAALEKTWSDEPPDFRVQILALIKPTLSPADEPFLTRVLKERRKDLRLAAQALLAGLPESALAIRMRERAKALLALQRGFLSKKIEVSLPAAFDPDWQVDGIEEQPPTGVGEKAFWAQQILGLVPVAHWARTFDLDVGRLVGMAAGSDEWADLLLGAWFRAACLHGDSDASAALLPPVLTRPKTWPPGTSQHAAVTALFTVCSDKDRWRLAAAVPEMVWSALPLLSGAPVAKEARALLGHLAKTLRDGYNPGGSPGAVLAARRIPHELRAEAAAMLARENGLSKPTEAFLHALELRASMHAAFSDSPPASPHS